MSNRQKPARVFLKTLTALPAGHEGMQCRIQRFERWTEPASTKGRHNGRG